ncbi:SH3 domain-containing protein [Maritimibacter sp. DP1N21-5]|uniref:SH3 domain-containing protein n=1 Tax=Maritimibacter sp. DP1N21-5 TaxID=2836867 RepID=UPI001C47456F|nr:SH3 domain-containing protein [Maritimibacter sp. DP1N21-5]MBV7408483.1 SH3 domain-containing protein [Maritimibacter sp. DP1N21-5]
MALLRLTLIATAALGAAMYHYGRDDGLPDDPLGRDTALVSPRLLGGPALAGGGNEKESDALMLALASDASPESATQLALVSYEPEVEPVISAKNPTAEVADVAPEPEEPEPEEIELALLYVSGSSVNVRGGPSTSFGVIDALGYGTPVQDLGDAGEGWREIRLLETGETGYMSGQFLTATP